MNVLLIATAAENYMREAALEIAKFDCQVCVSQGVEEIEAYIATYQPEIILVFDLEIKIVDVQYPLIYKGIEEKYYPAVDLPTYAKIIQSVRRYAAESSVKILRICKPDARGEPLAIWEGNTYLPAHNFILPPRHVYDLVLPVMQLMHRSVEIPADS